MSAHKNVYFDIQFKTWKQTSQRDDDTDDTI